MENVRVPEWDGIAERVGRVAMLSAQLEYVIANLVIVLIRSHLAFPVVVGQPWSASAASAEALIKERIGSPERPHSSPDDIAFYKDLLSTLRTAKTVMAQRNEVVHAMWDSFTDGDLRHSTLLWKRWGRATASDWTVGKLDELLDSLAGNVHLIDLAAARIADADEQAVMGS